ncbi:hypothetical protein J6590_105113 [Homalodisca vitripennis]|nr:hypothetical protein J6590_105113 [Homalodisca vitripennis]
MYGFRKHGDAQGWFEDHWAATDVRETASRMRTDVRLQEAPRRSRLVPKLMYGFRKHGDAQGWFEDHWAATDVRETASRMRTDVRLQEAPRH